MSNQVDDNTSSSASFMTGDVLGLLASPPSDTPRIGTLHNCDESSTPDSQPLYLNADCATSSLVIGPDDTGRSETVMALLKALLSLSDPQSGMGSRNALVLYLDECVAGLPPLPCKLAGIAQAGIPVTVLAPQYRLRDVQSIYSSYPVEVKALKFDFAKFWEAPVYHPVCPTHRQYHNTLDDGPDGIKDFGRCLRRFDDGHETFISDDFSLNMNARMDSHIFSFLTEEDTKETSHRTISNFFAPPKVVIVDLSCPMIGRLMCSLWFTMALREFLGNTQTTRKIVVCDNAEYFLKDTPFQRQISQSIEGLLRHKYHFFLHTIISTMDPCQIPTSLQSLISNRIIQQNASLKLIDSIIDEFLIGHPESHSQLADWLHPNMLHPIKNTVSLYAPNAVRRHDISGRSESQVQKFGRSRFLVTWGSADLDINASSQNFVKNEDHRDCSGKSSVGYTSRVPLEAVSINESHPSVTHQPRIDEGKMHKYAPLLKVLHENGQGALLSMVGTVCKSAYHKQGINTNKPGWLRRLAESAEDDGFLVVSVGKDGSETIKLTPTGMYCCTRSI